jgi:hypothetical protein
MLDVSADEPLMALPVEPLLMLPDDEPFDIAPAMLSVVVVVLVVTAVESVETALSPLLHAASAATAAIIAMRFMKAPPLGY